MIDEALDVYDQVLGRFPETAQLHLLRGHALKTVGRTDEAILPIEKLMPPTRVGDAYWSLANLKTFRFSSEEVMAMSNKRPVTTRDRGPSALLLCLGQAF